MPLDDLENTTIEYKEYRQDIEDEENMRIFNSFIEKTDNSTTEILNPEETPCHHGVKENGEAYR